MAHRKFLFYVAQCLPNWPLKLHPWNPSPLWAHVRDVPFDLFHQHGLSLVGGGIGDHVETD